jgi:hypothetical protein
MTTETGDAGAATTEVQQTEVQATQAETASAVQAAYDRVANPDKETVEVAQESQTAETPPEPILTNDQAKDLLEKVQRIPGLEKQLRDAGGRYGSLKQQLDEIQGRLKTQTTEAETVANVADAKELLADLRGEFPELADKMEGVISKVIASKSGGDVDKLVSERIQAAKQAEIQGALEILSEAHPDWKEVRDTTEYAEWKKTLPERTLKRFDSSTDPFYVAEMLDQHKEWLASKTQKPSAPAAKKEEAQPSKRLSAAVMPTNGTKQAIKGEPDAKASIRAGYERAAGKRL